MNKKSKKILNLSNLNFDIERLFRFQWIAQTILVIFIAVFAYKILMNIHLENANTLIDVAKGVTKRTPDWIAYQNRLLGPYSILSISKLTGISFRSAWAYFNAITLQIFCIMFFWILRYEGIQLKKAIGYLIFFLFSFLILQDYFFYAWDSIDLIIFTCFAYFILKSFSKSYFLFIFLLGILNRESALFIPIYLIIDGFQFPKGLFSLRLVKTQSFLMGITMIIGGMMYTKIIRDFLFISKSDGMPDVNHLIGNHIYLIQNLQNLFFFNLTNGYIYVTIFLIFSFGYFFFKSLIMRDVEIKLLIMSFIIFLNILIFGLINETRMHFILLPFFFFLWLSLNKKIRNPKIL